MRREDWLVCPDEEVFEMLHNRSLRGDFELLFPRANLFGVQVVEVCTFG